MIILFPSLGLGQNDTVVSAVKDTLYVDKPSFEEIGTYNAKDSIHSDLRNEKIFLYNEAVVTYGEIKLEAAYIEIDLKKNELTATYLEDSLGNKYGIPAFTDGSENITASSIRYNFETEKGFIEDVRLQQDENYLYMGKAKRQANEEIHFVKGRFTTCDLEEPHFHFQLSKAVMIPQKRIVSGPMNLWIKGVPTPLGLPFIVLPQQQENQLTGFIFPQVVPTSQYGFGFQDLGYYVPINDYLQTTFYGTLYSRGSFGLSNATDYLRRYKYRGSIEIGYERFRLGFPDNDSKKNIRVVWNHSKDRKSNPYWTFSSNVNFNSINNPQINIDPANQQNLNNSFNSDVRLERTFENLPIRTGIKVSTRQSTSINRIELVSPVYNLNMTQIFPLKGLVSSSRGWRQLLTRFGVKYDLEGKNSSSFADSLLNQGRFNDIQNEFRNGLKQQVTLQTTAGLFKNTWKVTPSMDYRTNYNFQTTEKFIDTNNQIDTRTIATPGLGQAMTLNVSATTVLYSYYRYIGPKKPLLRHVLTPSFGFSYIPNLNPVNSIINPTTGDTVEYSPFERSIYQMSSTRDQQLITFGFNNTFELKSTDPNDTINGVKKNMLIDQLSVTGNYDLLKDSMNLSDINLSMRVSPLRALSIVSRAVVSPYTWNDSTGVTLGTYALQDRGDIGRITSASVNTNVTLTSKESRDKLQSNKEKLSESWNAELDYYMLHPEYLVDFDIPWKLTIAHVYSVNVNTSRTINPVGNYIPLQTLNFNGDISFTERWKLSGNASFDFKTQKVTYMQMNFIRDLHCWTMTFNWTPISNYKFFSFQMNAKSSLFSEAKLRLQKPPFLL